MAKGVDTFKVQSICNSSPKTLLPPFLLKKEDFIYINLSYSLGSSISIMTDFNLLNQSRLVDEIIEFGMEKIFKKKTTLNRNLE